LLSQLGREDSNLQPSG